MAPDDHGDSSIEPPPVSLKNGFICSVLVDFLLESEEPVEDGTASVDHGEEPEHEMSGKVFALSRKSTVLNGWVAFKPVGRRELVTLHKS